MIPIETKDIEINDIKDIIELSNSRIAGLILYDRTHPHVSKVIKDKDYWNEFNDKSGMNWGIFVPLYEADSCSIPSLPKSVLDQFDLITNDLPCFVVLSYNDKGDLLFHTEKIDDSNEECAYKSLKNTIEIIATVEKGFLPENKQTENLFPMVESKLNNFSPNAFWKVMMKNIKKGVDIVNTISGIMMIFS